MRRGLILLVLGLAPARYIARVLPPAGLSSAWTPARLARGQSVRTRMQAVTELAPSAHADPAESIPAESTPEVLDAYRAAQAALARIPAPAVEPSAEELATGAAWREAFRHLLTDERFLEHGWARTPFKLDEKWDFAVRGYTMEDVARDVTRMPPQFVAHGVDYEGGIYNKAMGPGFTFADVDAAMDTATVVMLNAGFIVPKLAVVSGAMLDAAQLPVWLNVYLSKPGLKRSTQLHTDLQDVLLVQCSGRKRWRVYRPPPPSTAPGLNPFQRGKGTDHLTPARPEDLLLDTVMRPGEVLYVPAGFPHETDTIGEAQAETEDPTAREPAVHLTVGLDTHLWGLTYAKLREIALSRAKLPVNLPGGAPLTHLPLPEWSLLHSPLPVGFLAEPLLATVPHEEDARSALATATAKHLAKRLRAAEPDRFAAGATEALGLEAAAARMLQHHEGVLGIQARMYKAAAADKTSVDAIIDEMAALDEQTAALEAWAQGKEVPVIAAPTPAKAAKSGFGGQSKTSAPKGMGKKQKAKRKKGR